MGRIETLEIMAILRGAYPQFYRSISREEAEDTVNLWVDMFCDDNVQIVAAAVKALIATDEKGFPPHIGAVKTKIRQLTAPLQMTEAEAWRLVYKAVRRSGYNADEEYKKLPPMLQRLVGGPDQLRAWAMMGADTVQSVVASNFQRSYRAKAKSEAEYQAIPADVRAAIEAVSARTALNPGSEVIQ